MPVVWLLRYTNRTSNLKTALTRKYRIETKLPRNDHWNVLYQVTVFYADRKSKMAATRENNVNK
jgi:hypothetical protein